MKIDDLIYEHYGLENPSKSTINEEKEKRKNLHESRKKKINESTKKSINRKHESIRRYKRNSINESSQDEEDEFIYRLEDAIEDIIPDSEVSDESSVMGDSGIIFIYVDTPEEGEQEYEIDYSDFLENLNSMDLDELVDYYLKDLLNQLGYDISESIEKSNNKKINEAADNVYDAVYDYVRNTLESTIDKNLSYQMIDSKVNGYDADWGAQDGSEDEDVNLTGAFDSLVKAITDAAFYHVPGPNNESLNKEKINNRKYESVNKRRKARING